MKKLAGFRSSAEILLSAFIAASYPISSSKAQSRSEIDHVTDLLAGGKEVHFKKVCTLRLDQFILPCNDAVFIEYKDGGHVIQFNRGTKDAPVISFSGKLTDANTLTFNAASLRLGDRAVAYEDVNTLGICLLGTQAIGCVGRTADGRLIIAQVFDYAK